METCHGSMARYIYSMPELPEVECMVRRFRQRLTGCKILGFSATWPRQISPSVAGVRRAICGRRIARLGRRGKYMVFGLDDGSVLLVHLGMSGRLEWGSEHPQDPPHVRARWELGRRRSLLFCDARKFGRIRHAQGQAQALPNLGLEPLSGAFTVPALDKALRSRSRQLKPLLLDQSAVAGLGNIYIDEALHRARLHPLMGSHRLSRAQVGRLHRTIREVLREAIRRCGTTFDWVYPGGHMQSHLAVYGRAGEPCPRCGVEILRILVGQRSTHLCPACQKER